MGRKRLSDDEKRRRGTFKPHRALTAKPGGLLADVPEPPATLDKAGAEQWYRTAAFLIDRRRLTEVGLPQLERFCDAHEIYLACLAEIREKGPAIVHHNGTIGPNPALKPMKDALAEIHHFERQWGLTPAADAALPAPGEEEAEPDEFDI